MYPYRPDLPDPGTERRDRIATPLGVLAVAALGIVFAAFQPMVDAPEPPKPTRASQPADGSGATLAAAAEKPAAGATTP